MDKLLNAHTFVFNPTDNGGESLTLITKFIGNGDPITDTKGVFTNQELSLQSYCNRASFELVGAGFTPKNLRKLADELETIRDTIAIRIRDTKNI